VWSSSYVREVLLDCGYVACHAHYYYKPQKTYKHAQSQFISQLQPGGWFFKDADFLKAVPFDSHLEDNRELFIKERSNVLEVGLPKAQTDDAGEKIMNCEQDVDIVTHFYKTIKSMLPNLSVGYLAGEGVGWAIFSLIGQPVNLLVTEKNPETFKFLLQK
jgi:hypothetical protein